MTEIKNSTLNVSLSNKLIVLSSGANSSTTCGPGKLYNLNLHSSVVKSNNATQKESHVQFAKTSSLSLQNTLLNKPLACVPRSIVLSTTSSILSGKYGKTSTLAQGGSACLTSLVSEDGLKNRTHNLSSDIKNPTVHYQSIGYHDVKNLSKESSLRSNSVNGSQTALVRSDESYNFHYDSTLAASLQVDEESLNSEDSGVEIDDVVMLEHSLGGDFLHATKRMYVNLISASLIKAPNFKDREDALRIEIQLITQTIIVRDPEFILKVALYSRKELNIRTTSNFLLALASSLLPCRSFLQKYFAAAIGLPSDWIDVAELYQSFSDKSLNFGALPAVLRRVMIKKFVEFDNYQLAKYNKEKKPKKGKPMSKASSNRKTEKDGRPSKCEIKEAAASVDGNDEKLSLRTYTLKQLIRQLHISQPVEHVMCLLGKRYPEDPEAFRRAGLPGMWQEDKAGKRMRLPTPETWETQVSSRGNKAEVWQDLLDHKKLPYMAMLRNLRNMLKAGISMKHHNLVLRKLQDERSVINSKQFPFRYFSAYQVLQEMEKYYEKNQEDLVKQTILCVDTSSKSGRGGIRGRGSTRARRGRGGRSGNRSMGNLKGNKVVIAVAYDKVLLQRYREALDNAVKVAATHNVPPIKGATLLLVDCSEAMEVACGSFRGMGEPRTVLQVAVLLSIMCKSACEDCHFIIYTKNSSSHIQIEKGGILENMEDILTSCRALQRKKDNSENNLVAVLENILINKTYYNNFLMFSNGDRDPIVRQFIDRYRAVINNLLLFVDIDLKCRETKVCSSSGATAAAPDAEFQDANGLDVSIAGFSDQILRFVAERGDADQLEHVEAIDRRFHLLGTDKVPSNLLPLDICRPNANVANCSRPWRQLRCFISSTFRDMHAERNLLTRYVFPELRRRLARKSNWRFELTEVDLRWGVTEEETRDGHALLRCLEEVSVADVVLVLLGNRRGWVPPSNVFDQLPEHMVQTYQLREGMSVTEMECQVGVHRAQQGKAQLMLFQRKMPPNVSEAALADLGAENSAADEAMAGLRRKVQSFFETGCLACNVFYRASGAEVAQGCSVVTGIDEMANQALQRLWAWLKSEATDTAGKDASSFSKEMSPVELQRSFCEAQLLRFVGRDKQLKEVKKVLGEVKSGSLMLITGPPGCGKTAFMVALARQLDIDSRDQYCSYVESHFVAATPASTQLDSILERLIRTLTSELRLDYSVPSDITLLKKRFVEVLRSGGLRAQTAARSTHLTLLFDGFDLLDSRDNARSLDWLPTPLPKGCRVIISVVHGSELHKLLAKRSGIVEWALDDLDLLDRARFVSAQLARFRKKLDETAFNNQMRLLSGKKQSGLPLYLHIMCEELRVFGLFDQLSEKLKSLPNTVALMLNEVLNRLEMDLGADLLLSALGLLLYAKDGLTEDELMRILSFRHLVMSASSSISFVDLVKHVRGGQRDGTSSIPFARMLRLLSSLEPLLAPKFQARTSLLRLTSDEVVRCVRVRIQRAVGPMALSLTESAIHRLSAIYYWCQCDPLNDGSFAGHDSRAFIALPYHLGCAGAFHELCSLLCNLQFLRGKCAAGCGRDLLDNFIGSGFISYQAQREWQKLEQLEHFKTFKTFVFQNIDKLTRFPTLTAQLALMEPSESSVCKSALTAINKKSVAVLRLLNKDAWLGQESPNLVLGTDCWTHRSAPLSLDVSLDGHRLAVGNTDASTQLFHSQTGKVECVFYRHTGPVMAVCFVGANLLATASKDGSLALWDLTSGARVDGALEKPRHRRAVVALAADRQGYLLASAGWDADIHVWRVDKAECEHTFNAGRPLNSLHFHPSESMLLAACWDASIKIYDAFNKKRVAVLRGHKSSVRVARYSPSGSHIVSAAADGEVRVWHALSGLPVGQLQPPRGGGVNAITALAYTPAGGHLISGGADMRLRLWAGTLGQPLGSLGDIKEARNPASAVATSVKHSVIAVGYHCGAVRLYRLHAADPLWKEQPHTACIRGMMIVQNVIYSASDDYSCSMLDVWSGEVLHNVRAHTASILCLDVTDEILLTGSSDCTALMFSLPLSSNGNSSNGLLLTGHSGAVTAVAVNRNIQLLATGSKDMSILVFAYSLLQHKESKCVAHVLWHKMQAHGDWITALSWGTSKHLLISASNDATICVWNEKNPNKDSNTWDGSLLHTLLGHQTSITALDFGNHGCLASSSTDGLVKLWIVNEKKAVEITTLAGGGNSRANALAFLHEMNCESESQEVEVEDVEAEEEKDWGELVNIAEDKERTAARRIKRTDKPRLRRLLLVVAGEDGLVRLFQPLQANALRCWNNHLAPVTTVAAGTNGQLFSATMEPSLHFRQLDRALFSSDLPIEMINEPGHSARILCIAATTSLLATGAEDGSLLLWNAQGVLLNRLKVGECSITALCWITSSNSSSSSRILVVACANRKIIFARCSQWTALPTAPNLNTCLPLHEVLAAVGGSVHEKMLQSTAASLLHVPDVLSSSGGVIVCGHWNGGMSMLRSNGKHITSTLYSTAIGLWVSSIVRTSSPGHAVEFRMLTETKIGESYLRSGQIVQQGQGQFAIKMDDFSSPIVASVVTRFANFMAVGTAAGYLMLTELSGGGLPFTKKAHVGSINALCTALQSNGAHLLISGGEDTFIRVWSMCDAAFGQLQQRYLIPCPASITCLVSLLSNDVFVAGDVQGSVRFFSMSTDI